MKRKFFVFDTNSLISAALISTSVNSRAFDKVFLIGRLAISDATFSEFTEVIFRPKFDRYLTDERRFSIINRIEQDAKFFPIKQTVQACRDPKDDKFLELAVAAKASCIITGDQDLLILHPFNNIPILSAADFLSQF